MSVDARRHARQVYTLLSLATRWLAGIAFMTPFPQQLNALPYWISTFEGCCPVSFRPSSLRSRRHRSTSLLVSTSSSQMWGDQRLTGDPQLSICTLSESVQCQWRVANSARSQHWVFRDARRTLPTTTRRNPIEIWDEEDYQSTKILCLRFFVCSFMCLFTFGTGSECASLSKAGHKNRR